MQELIKANMILFGPDETTQPRRKLFLTEESRRQMSSVLQEAGRGKNDVDKLGLEFPYCHPVSLYEHLIGSSVTSTGCVLDFFAGSGTTGHAVISLNRKDGGNRKYVLVEQGEHFDTVLLPRQKKVSYTPEWKDGKPKRFATAEEAERSPRIMKVIRLESYEDTLNNLELRRTEAQQSLLDSPQAQGADGFREQ